MVEEAAAIARDAGCDVIVGIGGGSSMDTAKGVNVLMNNEPPIMRYFGVPKSLKPGVPLIFLPTTAGTGSEVTNMCVISCTSLNKKDSVVSPVCVAALAILDPDLTLGLPPKLTAATGVDAFSHAAESITGNQANPISDALSRDAIRTITQWLPIAVEDGKNLEAREKMLEASMFAGMAFTNGLVHLGHSIAHTLGAQFHIPHGVACGVCLPQVIEWTSRTEYKKVRMICEAMGENIPESSGWEEIGKTAKTAIRALTKKVGIPNLKELGIPFDALMKLPPLVLNDSGISLCPYNITGARVAQIFQEAYEA
jgi:alcohol dehydrogenase